MKIIQAVTTLVINKQRAEQLQAAAATVVTEIVIKVKKNEYFFTNKICFSFPFE